jgi:hypothetical protein
MDATTKTTLDLARRLASSGLTIAAIEIHTPDGRTWTINTIPAGRGRHADGHWGPIAGAKGGFRLFEIDRDQNTIDEHDPLDYDAWDAGDLLDYLKAVGQPKARPGTTPSTPTPSANHTTDPTT